MERGLALLRCFDPSSPLLGNADLVRRSGLSRSAVARLSYTLCATGFLKQDFESRKYRLGATAVAVGYPLLLSLDVRQRVRPAMQTLARNAHGAAFLAMRDRHRMVLIECCRADAGAGAGLDIGSSLSMVGSAVGRAWLANAPRHERDAVLRVIRRTESEDFERHWDAAKHERLRMLRDAYCVSDELSGGGLVSLAAVLGMRRGNDAVVIGCATPSIAAGNAEIGRQLAELARGVSNESDDDV
ncbi:IclR family transcriptional regulator [Piscinibacter sakaiensis]|uniref:IclR family transcriptional regulator n=1 Tax=Piscinibacter sakaiensis TaxID=1547922 RepID=UPI003AB0C680